MTNEKGKNNKQIRRQIKLYEYLPIYINVGVTHDFLDSLEENKDVDVGDDYEKQATIIGCYLFQLEV